MSDDCLAVSALPCSHADPQSNVLAPPGNYSGTQTVTVITESESRTLTANVAPVAPGFFSYVLNGRSYPATLFAGTGTLVASPAAVPGARAARSGDLLSFFATGLGATAAPVPAGQVLTQVLNIDNLSRVRITIDGVPAEVLFAGMTFTGVFQINVRAPANLRAGDLPVVLEVSGIRAPLILDRPQLTARRKRKRRATPSAQPLAHAREANDVWAIDFKGWFECGDGGRCDPLTVSDAASRYLLCCQAMDGQTTQAVQPQLERIFREFGMPARMRSDNGAPFASTGVGGLSRLHVWWVRLGIFPERIEPGEPQQNGRHERMHRTLQQETVNPAAENLGAQQQRFDQFRRIYNDERPHEGLQGDCPAEHYQPSARRFPERLPELEYPAGFHLRRADQDGKTRWKKARCPVGGALGQEVVGMGAVDHGV